MGKKLRYAAEAVLVYGLFGLFRCLPLDAASRSGGWLGRRIGPFLPWHRVAERNLLHVWPEMPAGRRAEILAGMWDNLGRTLAEYPWLSSRAMATRLEISDHDRALVERMKTHEAGIIFAAGHLANWEIAPLSAHRLGIPLVLIYRHANNPWVDRLICRIRARFFVQQFRKGRKGAQGLIAALARKQSVGLLVDQKMNDGIAMPFLGRPARTAAAITELSLRFQSPVILARVVRRDGVHFRCELREFLPTGQEKDAARNMMEAINLQLSAWVEEYPEQWLWIHRRWGKLDKPSLAASGAAKGPDPTL